MFQLLMDNPLWFLIAAIIGLATAWWIWGGAPEIKTPDVKGTVGGIGAGVAGAAGAAASGVADAAKGAAEAAGGVAGGAVDLAKDAAEGAVDAAKGAAETAGDLAGGAVDVAKDAAGAAGDAASGAAGAVAGGVAAAGAGAAAMASDAKDKVEEMLDKPKIAAAVGEPDDLTRIKGIGPKLNDLCHSLGVMRFDQIAKWTSEDVAEVDQYLKIKGRIDRDRWVDQAKLLAAGDDDGHKAEFG